MGQAARCVESQSVSPGTKARGRFVQSRRPFRAEGACTEGRLQAARASDDGDDDGRGR